MSNTKQLPPELVEKIRKELENIDSTIDARCAQIAVDCAEKSIVALKSQRYELTMQNKKVVQERDELIERIRIDNLFLDKWVRFLEQKNWHEEVVQEMKDTLSSNKQLLKNHEDGK